MEQGLRLPVQRQLMSKLPLGPLISFKLKLQLEASSGGKGQIGGMITSLTCSMIWMIFSGVGSSTLNVLGAEGRLKRTSLAFRWGTRSWAKTAPPIKETTIISEAMSFFSI